MIPTDRTRQQFLLAIVAGTVLGGVLGALVIAGMVLQPALVTALAGSPTPLPSLTPTPTSTDVPTPTVTLTVTPLPTPTSSPSPAATDAPEPTAAYTPGPTRTPRPIVQHFLVGRPVGADAKTTRPSWVYLYGTTEKGDLDVHHGEEFENPIGTPLYAVADGTVVVAGQDSKPLCGDDHKTVCGRDLSPSTGGFYGNLVVIQLAQLYDGERVFALYGHMSQIDVSAGDAVKAGDRIGAIGEAGVATGPHVHFEIRLGSDDYAHTRNPILWMTPLPGRGSFAGRYSDSKGNLVRGAVVDIYRPDGTFVAETETYGHDRWPDVNSDDDLGENFAMGDMLPGDYIIRVNGRSYAARVTVEAGRLSFVEIVGL